MRLSFAQRGTAPLQICAEPKLTHREGRALWLAMARELRERHLMAPSPARSLARLALLLVLLAAALRLAWFGAGWAQLALAHAALVLLLAQFVFIGHDAGHGSLARGAALNRALGQIGMTLVGGVAFDEWTARHRAHHRHCQVEARDPDMAVGLAASLTRDAARGKGALGRFMTRRQAWLVWALSLFFGHSQRHLSQAAALGRARRHPLDAAVLPLHAALWFGLPCLVLGVPWLTALLAYALPVTILGPYLAAIFWVNHVGMPLIREPDRFSFFEHQYVASRTLNVARAWHWIFGGLNFQIEHHLFPQAPARRLPAVQAVVRRHAKRHRIAYRGVSWREALRAVGAHLRQVARAA